MELAITGPLRAALLRWILPTGGPAVTVVCKATFNLRPGESPLASQQDEPNEDDTYWDDDPQRSLSASTDMVPYKARADVVLVGSAYSSEPVRSLLARLAVGTVNKSIEVHADRAFGPDGLLREGLPFNRMRLRYERAAGGPETTNPVGIRADQQDSRGNIPLPNLQAPSAHVSRRGEGFLPIGFGPIAPLWRERLVRIQRWLPGWSPYDFARAPLPDGFDGSYFNVAPQDQQLESVNAGEQVVLEHLHPEHTRVVTRLSAVEPRVTLERPGGSTQSIALTCDTLSIDTDRGVCHLVWRGTVVLAHPAETGRIVVSTHDAHAATGWEGSRNDDMAERTIAPMDAASPLSAMPFGGRVKAPPAPPRVASQEKGLPFQREAPPREAPPPPRQPAPRAPTPSDSGVSPYPGNVGHAPPTHVGPTHGGPTHAAGRTEGTQVYELPQQPFSTPLPLPVPPPPPPNSPHAVHPPVPPPIAPPPPAAPPVPRPPPAIPPPVPAIPVPVSPPPQVELSPWANAGSSAPAQPAPSSGSFGERLTQESPQALTEDRSRRGEPEHLGTLPRPVEKAAPTFLAAAAVAGVVAASNAAADPLPPAPVRGASKPRSYRQSTDAVDLVWFDGESVARVRKRPPWRVLLLDLEEATEQDPEEAVLGNTPEEIEDRRDMLHVLLHAQSADEYGISESLNQAVRADGKIINPVIATAGQLAFVFDELEMLKATLSAALPFAAGDEPLTSATTSAKEFLSTPGLVATGVVIDSLTTRIREAFLRVKRPVANDYLTVQSERALLEKRHYQKREVLSKTHLRGLFFPDGSSNGIPTYLPEEVSKKLPLYQRFSVRMIVEVHRTADQNEVHPAALKVLALGRSIHPGRG
ncbi:MAG: DUF2169 domain-containing protein [Polyangiaceae bacterium]|nr:DUF2169 domain-containing protein [Polyangiaceae bacterium]